MLDDTMTVHKLAKAARSPGRQHLHRQQTTRWLRRIADARVLLSGIATLSETDW